MTSFRYNNNRDELEHEPAGNDQLTVEEAQVLATMQVAENLASIGGTLDDILHLIQNHALDIKIVTDERR